MRDDGTTYHVQGFYTTRFVQALSAAKASRMAIGMVERELEQFDPPTRPACHVTVDEVYVDAIAFEEYAPGKGFTWY